MDDTNAPQDAQEAPQASAPEQVMVAGLMRALSALQPTQTGNHNLNLSLAALSKVSAMLLGPLPASERAHVLALVTKQLKADVEQVAAHIAANPSGAPSSIVLN